MQTTRKALVIGGGFGGMAAALRLRAKGYAVEIAEKLPALGGRAQVFEKDGYRHDSGPTVITAPFLFEELFQLFGKNLHDYVTLKELTPWYRFVFPDGRSFDYGGTVEETLDQIAKFNPSDQDGYLRLVEGSRKIFEIGFEKLADQPFNDWRAMASTLPHLVSLRADRNVWQFVCSHISDPCLRQAFSIQPLLVGGNPFNTTCIYSLIHYLERKWGIHFVMGGTGALVKALQTLMTEEGIEISLNTDIERLEAKNGKIDAACLHGGGEKKADIFVSNCDPAFLYSRMINRKAQSLATKLKTRKARFSMGLYVLYFGTAAKYENIAHHTIWLGKRYKALLNDIFDRKIMTGDFSLYLHRPTATDPAFAPEGHESFYVLAPVPNLQGNVNWSEEGPALRDRIVEALDKTILPDLKNTIRSDFFMTPEDFRDDYNSLHGAGFSIAPLLSQSAWFRYHNKAEGFQNLYLTGAGTHPGAGLPGVVSSAKVIEKLVA